MPEIAEVVRWLPWLALGLLLIAIVESTRL